MDLITADLQLKFRRKNEWRLTERSFLVILYIFLLTIQCNCQTITKQSSQETITKSISNLDSNVDTKHCHSCQISSKKIDSSNSNSKNNLITDENEENEEKEENTPTESFIEDVLTTFSKLSVKLLNKTKTEIEDEFEKVLDSALSKDRYVIVDGIEVKTVDNNVTNDKQSRSYDISEKRTLFSKFSYEYRMFQKIKDFVETHVISINLPKAARLIGFRSFGLKKLFIPLLIGAQVFKSILLAMFLPSILGSFGKILGKGISTLSATSSQASYPPAPVDDQNGYSNDNKDFEGHETDPHGVYAYPQDGVYMNDVNDINDLANVDMSRFGEGQKVNYLPTKPGYYKNQLSSGNNYKVFQKIPASSMILSNYDPFYSPLLSRLDGIFARLGFAPQENEVQDNKIGGQSLSSVKLESCREQLICLMYASPAKYAPYSNLVSAQLSRELNELRRPVSDNPEILRFFRYMRAARRGQEGTDCMRAHPGCSSNAAPAHTMIAAYHDINKLVTARKLNN